MGRWDVVLPFVAPGRGTPEPPRHRTPLGGGGPEPSSDESDVDDPRPSEADGVCLPDVEEIYDWLTEDLAGLEETLGQRKRSGALSAKEEKLHQLIHVELRERRGVEEIGLALLGGRLNLDVAGLEKRPEVSPFGQEQDWLLGPVFGQVVPKTDIAVDIETLVP